jgi:hypothetical protein
MEEYWLKYGFKENGELICVRVLSSIKPDKKFFYTDGNMHKEAQNPVVIKLTKENINKLE